MGVLNSVRPQCSLLDYEYARIFKLFVLNKTDRVEFRLQLKSTLVRSPDSVRGYFKNVFDEEGKRYTY